MRQVITFPDSKERSDREAEQRLIKAMLKAGYSRSVGECCSKAIKGTLEKWRIPNLEVSFAGAMDAETKAAMVKALSAEYTLKVNALRDQMIHEIIRLKIELCKLGRSPG